ncbi:MAG: 30S ribosomal protein S1 [Alphaproteobacteria bacterium]|nr:30S ribosomal protein S1 [Alphaproteobacteria bacterium]MBR6675653.1 30S ribosomal protein S1 [Alphaproteobacteria bacterium]
MTKNENTMPSMEDFGALLDEYMGKGSFQGKVVSGKVIGFDDDIVIVDVGLKSEGRIPLRECGMGVELSIGDNIDVYIDRYEDKDGNVVLSREKARREEAWGDLEKAMEKGEHVIGTIFGRVKGGFTVDLNGATAFLPGSQIDVRPIRDVTPLMGVAQPFALLKMDKLRGNIVVSRRAVLEETRAEQRTEMIKNLKEGEIVDGTVKNITDYGAFIDLGGVDGLLHVTDISWKRITNPAEILSVGQTVKVQVIKFNTDTGRVSLGMKQLEEDPWIGVNEKFAVGTRFTGKISNIADYGVFIELAPGVEGLVHVSEMSWTKKNVHPSKIVSLSQEVEVIVLDVDESKRRISLGMKQIQENPWKAFADSHNVGDEIEGEVKNMIEFGIFIALNDDIDGMIHTSDLSWDVAGEEAIKEYKKGQMVKAKILDIDVEKERISLGVKQLTEDPAAGAMETLKKGEVVTGIVSAIEENGIEVDVNGLKGYIKRTDLAKDKSEQKPERFAVGEKVDAKVTTFDAKNRKLTLSIKAKEVDEDKKAMEEFGSTNAGASLGDILGAALVKKAKKAKEETAEEKPAKAKRTKKAETAETTDAE